MIDAQWLMLRAVESIIQKQGVPDQANQPGAIFRPNGWTNSKIQTCPLHKLTTEIVITFS
jgi:hypothetical protein